MGSRYKIEVTIRSARDLMNVNWRNGNLRPYAVVWIDSSAKSSTKVDIDHDTEPEWNEKLIIALPPNFSLRNATLYIDVVHANATEDVKPLVGSARLPLFEVVNEAGIGGKLDRTLKLKRVSGRPHGKLDIRVAIKESPRYYDPHPHPPPAYGKPYGGQYGWPATAAPPTGYSYGGPPAGGPSAGYPYGGPPAGGKSGGYPYGGPQPAYGGPASAFRKKSKFGMGTGLAVGAAAGVLSSLALAEGLDYVEDDIEDDVAEKVEEDYYDDDF